ncbi:MAG: helix-turn-helix domain-containing protein, partial [Clostridiales bacterium]|nr:helix-turn-helix domain-containing protein [Clostridiales bacterium]
MSNEIKKYKHLSYRERAIIEHALNNRATFTDIAKTLGRNKSTIAREVQKNFSILKANHFNNSSENSCVKRTTCKKTNLCAVCTERHEKCSSCKRCNLECSEYDP